MDDNQKHLNIDMLHAMTKSALGRYSTFQNPDQDPNQDPCLEDFNVGASFRISVSAKCIFLFFTLILTGHIILLSFIG